MDKNTIKLIIIGICTLLVVILLITGLKNIKIDEFKPATVIFAIDASASNQAKLDEQKKFVKQFCNRLDPEDKVKIIKVSENAYLIYEGSAHNSKNISDSMNAFTQYEADKWGTAYGTGIEKALGYALSMQKEGYNPAVVVVGDLENEGKAENQINWDTLPGKIKKVQEISPDFAMMFAYAHPEKLDMVKTALAPVLGESKLVISTEQTIDKSLNEFLTVIGR